MDLEEELGRSWTLYDSGSQLYNDNGKLSVEDLQPGPVDPTADALSKLPGATIGPPQPSIPMSDVPVREGAILPITKYADGSVRFDAKAGLLGQIVDAMTLAGDVFSGKIPPFIMDENGDEIVNPAIIPRVLNLAGTVMTGGVGAAPKGGVILGTSGTKGGLAAAKAGVQEATAPIVDAVKPYIVSDAEHKATNVGLLAGNETLDLPAKPKLIDVATALNDRTIAARGAPLVEQTPENQTAIARTMAEEAINAAQKEGNAITWYRDKVDGAHKVVAQIHPEIDTDPQAKTAFNYILAVTSNGASVQENARNAEAVYKTFKETGQMPLVGFGKETNAMKKSFETWNTMSQEMGIDNWLKFLDTDFTVGELKRMGYSVGGELVDQNVKGSVILGPKIGGGFFQNLQGNFNSLTMDRWWMRSWGRWTGTLRPELDPATAEKQLGRFREAISTPEGQAAAAKYGIDPTQAMSDNAAAADLASKLYRDYAKDGFKDRNEINRSAQRIAEGMSQVLEQPGNGSHRKFMRDTTNEALAILRENGYNMDAADLQALLWYPEKELYRKFGVGDAKSAPTDYEAEFRKIATERGIALK